MIENKFITAILDRKIFIDDLVKKGFDTTWLKNHGDIYEYLVNYHDQNGQLPSYDLITTQFPIFAREETTDNPDSIVESIRVGSELNRFYSDIRGVLNILDKTGSVDKAKEFLETKIEKYNRVGKETIIEITSDDYMDGVSDYALRRLAYETDGVYGISSGFGREFDGFINGGWQKKNLYGIIGASGVSKTWLTLVSVNAALMSGKKVLMVALEGSIREYYRLISISTGLSNNDINSGKVPLDLFKEHEKKLREKTKQSGGKLFVEFMGERDMYTPSDLRKAIKKVKPDLVIIDYLTLMKKRNSNDIWAQYLEISQETALIAAGFDIPILVVLQGVISSLEKDEITMEDIASSKGMARDFGFLFGVTKVKGKQFIIKINDVKARDGASEFSAFYNVNWDKGIIKFYGYSGDNTDL